MCLNGKDEINQIFVEIGNVHVKDQNVYLSIIIVE
jgi:hypothetical protein